VLPVAGDCGEYLRMASFQKDVILFLLHNNWQMLTGKLQPAQLLNKFLYIIYNFFTYC